MNFIDRVKKYEYKLNDTDDLIIEFLTEHQSEINSISIKDIASKLYVAPNTIMRLAKKLEYSGFSELKALLNVEDNNHTEVIPFNISKTLDLMDQDMLYTIANKIKNCKRVYFFGVGDSTYYADMMCANLKVLEKPAESFHFYNDIEYRVNNCSEDDLVVFISAKGNNLKLIEYAKQLKEKAITMVLVTHFDNNELSKISDYNLYFWGEERKVSGYDVSDRTGMMIVLRALSEVFWRTYCV
jgi:DNA-binding MurR/RpiR family transcriptional regulator